MRYVDTVTHREMRNNSGEILRRVEAGETITVTNNGRVAAVLVPPSSDVLTELARRVWSPRLNPMPSPMR